MTVSEYAKEKGVSKQSVYDRIRRHTLHSETINGIKHIVESSSQDNLFNSGLPAIDKGCQKKLDKTLDKLQKALKKADKFKQKLLIERVKLRSMDKLVLAKDSEIDSIKQSLGLVQAVINSNLLQIEEKIEDAVIIKPKKKQKKKKK